MRVRCLVDELPQDVRMELDAMLADTGTGYVEASLWLQEQGYSISKSSIGRYAQRSGKARLRLREISEMAKEYVRLLKDDQEIDIAKVASSIYLQQLMTRIVEAGADEFADISLEKSGRLLIGLMRSSVYEGRYTKQRKEEFEEAAELILQQFRAELVSDPDMLQAIQSKVQASRQQAAAEQGVRP